MGAFGLSPAASSPAMASPVTGLSGLAHSLSLSRLSQPVRGVRVSGFRGVERVREMRGRERGSGTRGEKVN